MVIHRGIASRLIGGMLVFCSAWVPALNAQPFLVKNINTAAGEGASSFPRFFSAFDDRVVFAAGTDELGFELWASEH